MVEYALLVAAIVALVALTVYAIGGQVQDLFGRITVPLGSHLSVPAPGPGGPGPGGPLTTPGLGPPVSSSTPTPTRTP